MGIKMIALDLDGTTLNSKEKITSANKETIEEAIRRGIKVVISTGRSYTALPKDVWDLHGLRYVVSSNGAHITDMVSGEHMYDSYISLEAIEDVTRLTKEHDLMIEVFYNDRAFTDTVLYKEVEKNGSSYRNREYVLRTREPIDDILGYMWEHKTRIENINIFFEHPEERIMMMPVIEQGMRKATITSSFPNNIEIGGEHTSKSEALMYLADRLDIDRAELLCCGDAPNDIAMLTNAGIGVAMGNAWDVTKEAADYVTLTNDDSGVAAAIKKFAL